MRSEQTISVLESLLKSAFPGTAIARGLWVTHSWSDSEPGRSDWRANTFSLDLPEGPLAHKFPCGKERTETFGVKSPAASKPAPKGRLESLCNCRVRTMKASSDSLEILRWNYKQVNAIFCRSLTVLFCSGNSISVCLISAC